MRHNTAQRLWRWITRETPDRRPMYFMVVACGVVTAASGGLRLVFDRDPARLIDVGFVLLGGGRDRHRLGGDTTLVTEAFRVLA